MILTLPLIRPAVIIGPKVLDANEPTVSSIIDVMGYESVEFVTVGGPWLTGASVPLLLEHGELANGSDMAPIPDAFLFNTEAGATVNGADTAHTVGIRIATGKRYARVTVSPAGVHPTLVPSVALALIPKDYDLSLGVIDGPIIDTDGYAFVDFPIALGDLNAGGKFGVEVVIRHGDLADGSDFTTATDFAFTTDPLYDTAMLGTSAVIAILGFQANSGVRFAYFPGSTQAHRYVRLRISPVGASPGDTAEMGCAAERMNVPTSPAFTCLALLRSRRTLNGT